MSKMKVNRIENTATTAGGIDIDSSGKVGIGTSSPNESLEVVGNGLKISGQTSGVTDEGITFDWDSGSNNGRIFSESAGSSNLLFYTTNSGTRGERMRIDSSGRLLVGTTTEGQANAANLTIADSGTCGITLRSASNNFGRIYFSDGTSGDAEYRGIIQYDHSNDRMQFAANASTAMTIDSSGRLLVGTSTPDATYKVSSTSYAPKVEFKGTDVYQLALNRTNGSCNLAIASKQTASSGTGVGAITFNQWDGSSLLNAASIAAVIDGTPGSNDMPGRLVFSTTADGASSPTERMRIDSNGDTFFGTTAHQASASSGSGGHFISSPGSFATFARSSGNCVYVNRISNDGNLIEFRQNGTTEGNINVSGSTVALAGAHLTRYSQLPEGAVRTEILRGSVLSNLDEMCEWGEEDNEQLNRMQVSDVEGDKNVSGVFQGWDDDDDIYVNDFYCAMTGDFVIRIAQGTTVARGDLLMSAGDGTAKPQDDDIIRSKTIAKVTSTNVSETYADGSYCVPCVLMAC